MMRIKNFLRSMLNLFFVVSLWGFGGTASVDAQIQQETVNFLVEMGINHYEKGDVDEAIHEFSKALLLDPQHEMAKQYLVKMGLSDGLYKKVKSPSERVVELTSYLRQYEGKVAQLKDQKRQIEDQLGQLKAMYESLKQERNKSDQDRSSQEKQLQDLQSQLEDLQEKLKYEQHDQLAQQKKIEAFYEERQQDLKQKAKIQQEQLAQQKILLQQTIDQLRSLQRIHEKYLSHASYDGDQLATLGNQYNQLREEFFVTKAKNQHMWDVLEDYAYVRNSAFHELYDQVIANEIDLTNTKSLLMNRLNELVDTYASADQYRRLLHVQKIQMREENEDMRGLNH